MKLFFPHQKRMRSTLISFLLINGVCLLWMAGFTESGCLAFHPQPPSAAYLLGTTTNGFDISFILAKSIIQTLWFLTVTVSLVFFFSVTLGIVFGYFCRLNFWVPMLRIIEIVNSIPLLMVLVILGYYHWLFWGSFLVLMLLFKWPLCAQVSQGLAMSYRLTMPVLLAQMNGISDLSIIRRYFIPNIFKALIPKVPTLAVSLFNTLTIMDFLGYSFLGTSMSLGSLVAEGKDNLYAPWILLGGLGGLLIVLVPFILLSFSVVSEGNKAEERYQ